MDYNKLRTLLCIKNYGSMTKAANHLGRSQSAISQQIQVLENELGLKLIERKAGKIFLSNEGLSLCQAAASAFNLIDNCNSKITQKSRLIEGTIKLGVVNSETNQIPIEQCISSFCQKFPSISFELSYGTNQQIEKAMLDNQIDLGIIVYFQQPELFIRQELQGEKHRLYSSHQYIQKTRAIKNYKAILKLDLIDIDQNLSCFKTWFNKNSPTNLKALSHQVPSIIGPNHRSIAKIIDQGHGIGLIPNYLSQKDKDFRNLVELMPKAKPVITTIDIAYRTLKNVRHCEEIFLSFLKKFIS